MGNCKSKSAPRDVAQAQAYSRTTDDPPKPVAGDFSAKQVAALKAAGFQGANHDPTSRHGGNEGAEKATRAVSSGKAAADDRKLVFVLGGPGSGKGTQCEKLQERFGFAHLSVGDLLRAEAAKPDSPLGAQLQEIMREGRLVPDDITVSVLQRAIAQTPPGSVVLVDGFPRSLGQAAAAGAALGRPLAVLYFDGSEDTMKRRLLGRARTTGRVDDTEETIVKRLRTFAQLTLPVRNHYEKCALLRVVDAEPPPDQVFENVCRLVEELTAAVSAHQPPQPDPNAAPPQPGTVAEVAAAVPASGTAAAAGGSGANIKTEADAAIDAAVGAVASDQALAEAVADAESAGAASAQPSDAADAASGKRQDGKTEEAEDSMTAVATDAAAAAAGEPLFGVGGTGANRQQEAAEADGVTAAAAAAGGASGAADTGTPKSVRKGSPGVAAVEEPPIMANTAAASKSAKAAAARKSLQGQAPAKGGRRTTGPRVSSGARASGSPRASGGPRRSESPAKRRTSSRAPVAAFPGVSRAGDTDSADGGGGGGGGAGTAAAEGQRTADEASLLLGDAGAEQQTQEAAPAPQAALPPALLLPDQGDDEMMANAKRIAAEAMGLRQPGDDASTAPQGRGAAWTGSRKAAAAAPAKKQPFSWIYGDDEEIAAEAAALLHPLEHLAAEAKAAQAAAER